MVHQERFYTRHQTYDRDHLPHRLLRQALGLLAWPDAEPVRPTAALCAHLRYDRKTAAYRPALRIVRPPAAASQPRRVGLPTKFVKQHQAALRSLHDCLTPSYVQAAAGNFFRRLYSLLEESGVKICFLDAAGRLHPAMLQCSL